MEIKDLSQINYASYNPRTLSEHDGKSLDASMTTFGDLSGITNNLQTNTLVTGHQRLRILEKKFQNRVKIEVEQKLEAPDDYGTVAIGYVKVEGTTLRFPYREVNWNIGVEKAANIAANRIEASWDKDMLAQIDYELSLMDDGAALLALTGQDEDELSKLLDSVGANGDATVEEQVPEVDNSTPPISKLGEIYQLGDHRLMCGDSTDFGSISDLMNGNTADLVFTDPPYGVSYQSNMRTESVKFDVIKNDDKLITEWIDPVLAVSNGFIFIWTSWKILCEWLDITKNIGQLTNMIIWDKGGGGIGDLQGTYISDYEIALVFNRGAKLTGDRLGSVWNIGKDAPSTYEHPTQKPTGLGEQAMKTVTTRGQLVLDVFGGSGSTMIAAEKTGRISYTMELDPKYCDVIRKRYAKHIGQENWQEVTPVIQSAETQANQEI